MRLFGYFPEAVVAFFWRQCMKRSLWSLNSKPSQTPAETALPERDADRLALGLEMLSWIFRCALW